MNKYYIANDKINLKCYPNYSFEIGDVNGDGKMEFISMDQSGNLLSVFDINGEIVFEKILENNGNWGTAIPCVADINSDGCDEVIVQNGKSIIAFDGKGNIVKKRKFEIPSADMYKIYIPLLGAANIVSPTEKSIIAAIAGGVIYALDHNLDTIWKIDGFRNSFLHEFYFADVDGDGLDEILFSTVDQFEDDYYGDFILLDNDGKQLFSKDVQDYLDDSHFDDIAVADFLGDGSLQILVEKGFLLDLKGNVIWDLSGEMDHGQWIAHVPDPNSTGRIAFISELWGYDLKSMLFTGQGQKIRDARGYPWAETTDERLLIAPSRCHAIYWDKHSEPEFFLTQQAVMGDHYCKRTIKYDLIALFFDVNGNLLGTLPFEETQTKGYYYNGEIHSKVADVDGDGCDEIVFIKQDGHVMIIKKRG